MATSYYDADDYYFLKKKTNELNISVTLGEQMNGGYLIFNGDKLISTNSGAQMRQSNIADEWITITVIIKDRQEVLSWASVMIALQEDSQIPKTFGPFRRKMEKNIDTVCFTIKIKIRE